MASPQMFIVVATRRSDDVRREIESLFDADRYFDLTSYSWLVSFEGTTRALAERLGIREGTNGSGQSSGFKMARAPRSSGPEIPAPPVERPGDAGSSRDALWLLSQQVHEITADLGKLIAKTDRLISDVAESSKELKNVQSSINLAKGFGLCAMVLIPVCAGLIWWLIGSKLTDLRDQVIASRPPPAASAQTPSGK